jgi:hypothetical protein
MLNSNLPINFAPSWRKIIPDWKAGHELDELIDEDIVGPDDLLDLWSKLLIQTTHPE